MKDNARSTYFAVTWPAACKAQKWDKTDSEQRHEVILQCMEAINSRIVTSSIKDLGDAETTALFCYTQHLADPLNITLVMRWEQCKQDYIAYHNAKTADWHQKKTYGDRHNKLIKQRFKGRDTALGDPGEKPLSRRDVNTRLYTMRNRHFRKHAAGRDVSPQASDNSPHQHIDIPF